MNFKKQIPVYNDKPLENLKAWLEFNMSRWHIDGNKIIFDGPQGKSLIGNVLLDESTNSLTMEIKTTNHYMVVLINKGNLAKDLKMNIILVHKA